MSGVSTRRSSLYLSLRSPEYVQLEKDFRNAVVHNKKDIALEKLELIKRIVGEDDPFFITASMALNRME